MTTLKERIPNEDVLRSLLESQSEAVFARVKETARDLERAWKRNRRFFVVSLFPLVLAYLLFRVWPVSPESYSQLVVFVVLVAFFGLTAWLWSKMNTSKTAFDREVNRIIFAEVFSIMGISGTLSPSSNASVHTQLDQSELITESRNTVAVGDQFTIKAAAHTIFVHELNVKNVISFGDRYHYTKRIFNGYFVETKLSRTLTGKTFVSTDGDDSGFGHASFWTKLTGGGVKETTMEWNEFENLLHVATTDETEARYVLTPDFMQDLYDWWSGQKGNIRITFLADHMYLLFPDKKVRVDGTVSGLSRRKVNKYMFSIARPLLHVVHLIEGVRG